MCLAAIGFTDPRYAARFKEFPMPHPFREVLGMILAELRRRPAQIQFLDVVTARECDLVCIGSPHMVAVDGRSGPLVPGVRCREPHLCAGREPFAVAVP